nr:uncharacterized protein LOC115259453 [Aedes albopictus]
MTAKRPQPPPPPPPSALANRKGGGSGNSATLCPKESEHDTEPGHSNSMSKISYPAKSETCVPPKGDIIFFLFPVGPLLAAGLVVSLSWTSAGGQIYADQQHEPHRHPSGRRVEYVTWHPKQSSNRQPPKKSAGAKPPNTKPAGQSSTAPALTSSAAFPELPKPPSQNEQSASVSQANSQPDKVDLTISPREQPQSTRATSSSIRPPPQASEVTDIVDLFRKPAYVLRSHSKSGNGNESDESSASTSSSRSRHRPPGKKPRREGKDDEQGEDRQL